MPDRYAVIGHPIAHSKSPLIHGLFAQATRQDMVYEAIDGGAEPGGFARTLAAFAAAGGRGVNVTLPFKLDALAAADTASDDARLAGAANALRFDDGRIEARNFDGIGLVRDIEANLAVPLAGRRVLLLGAGGATRGALLPIARAGAARIAIANRTAHKAVALARELAPHLPATCALEGDGLHALAQAGAFDVLINATAASLGGEEIPVPTSAFGPGALAYDMVYGKGLTPFLRRAQTHGAHVADGVGMLVEQAAEAFAWWRGVRPDTREALARLTVPLQ